MPSETQPLLPAGQNGQSAQVKKFDPVHSTRHLLLGSWLNLLLVAIPLAFIGNRWTPLARLGQVRDIVRLHHPSRKIAWRLHGATFDETRPDTRRSLECNVGVLLRSQLIKRFGNAVELIVAIAALRQNELRLVQTSLLGSVLSNLLLVLGMSFFAAGFFFHESTFQVTAAQASSSLMTLATITLILPAAYHFSNASDVSAIVNVIEDGTSDTADPSFHGLLVLSRGTSIILLGTYIAYLVFQLKTHAALFEADATDDEEEVAEMDQTSAGLWLIAITVITAFAADILVGSIDETAQQWHIPKRYAAMEHVTSVWMACKGKMELTIGVAVGSSIQIAAGMIPLLVIVAWTMGKDLTLFFANFETIVLFVSVLLVNLLLQDGRSNYMEGLMLIALYLVIALSYIVS
ncbi:Ca2+:H+ antiporter, partial [Tremellales sp. Uapishka_1]